MTRLVFLLALSLTAAPAWAARTVLVFGDSLSAGYGLRSEEAWPALLGQRLRGQGADYSVVNLSISGETTAGGRSRLAAALAKHQPAVVVIALGANDGLRGLPLGQMRDNLVAMIRAAQGAGARVLIAGMRLPPNYGPYAQTFETTFRQVSDVTQAPLLPFLLAGVAEQPALFQADNLHPVAAAQPIILDTVWRALSPLLR